MIAIRWITGMRSGRGGVSLYIRDWGGGLSSEARNLLGNPTHVRVGIKDGLAVVSGAAPGDPGARALTRVGQFRLKGLPAELGLSKGQHPLEFVSDGLLIEVRDD